ncbi:glutathione S-transferase family protein [Nannocystis pusilla]|uniref:Glutathione S-transferase family protein n=1 Tax=Nannocystis pusilla TaxID=889268 RepID=A0A9X3EZX8_9BACT|nr:glutathione S-transferase family protein [Nannocystis pusilla]
MGTGDLGGHEGAGEPEPAACGVRSSVHDRGIQAARAHPGVTGRSSARVQHDGCSPLCRYDRPARGSNRPRAASRRRGRSRPPASPHGARPPLAGPATSRGRSEGAIRTTRDRREGRERIDPPVARTTRAHLRSDRRVSGISSAHAQAELLRFPRQPRRGVSPRAAPRRRRLRGRPDQGPRLARAQGADPLRCAADLRGRGPRRPGPEQRDPRLHRPRARPAPARQLARRAARGAHARGRGPARRRRAGPADSGPRGARQGARELASGFLKRWAGAVERRLGELGSGPFISGETLHVADLKLYMVARWFSSGNVDHVPSDVFAEFPRLSGIERAVAQHPKIVAWYAR